MQKLKTYNLGSVKLGLGNKIRYQSVWVSHPRLLKKRCLCRQWCSNLRQTHQLHVARIEHSNSELLVDHFQAFQAFRRKAAHGDNSIHQSLASLRTSKGNVPCLEKLFLLSWLFAGEGAEQLVHLCCPMAPSVSQLTGCLVILWGHEAALQQIRLVATRNTCQSHTPPTLPKQLDRIVVRSLDGAAHLHLGCNSKL